MHAGLVTHQQACQIRYRTTFHFHYVHGESCIRREVNDDPDRLFSATIYQFDAVLRFFQGDAIYCPCGRSFDDPLALAAHQRECQLVLETGEACSPLTFLLGMLPQLGLDADTAHGTRGREHGFGTHCVSDLRTKGDDHEAELLTTCPFFPVPP
jgi:hypothetical protein